MPCSIRSHEQGQPAPAAFYELILHAKVSYIIIISLYYSALMVYNSSPETPFNDRSGLTIMKASAA
jgi:hypothetical protein